MRTCVWEDRFRTELKRLEPDVRRSDMKVLVAAFDEVFTFHPTELVRFIEFLEKTLPAECFDR